MEYFPFGSLSVSRPPSPQNAKYDFCQAYSAGQKKCTLMTRMHRGLVDNTDGGKPSRKVYTSLGMGKANTIVLLRTHGATPPHLDFSAFGKLGRYA